MKTSSLAGTLLGLVVMLALLSTTLLPQVSAQSGGGNLNLNPTVVPGGGGASSSGNQRITGSIGQHTTANSSAGSFTLDSAFWNAAFPCIGLSRPHFSFTSTGGEASVNTLGQSACSWTALNNNPEFITITSSDSGSGVGTISFSVPSHAGTTPRTGSITIAGQTFRVFQGILFNDVPVGHLFFTEIGRLSARSVTLGCGGGNYCPDQPVTREQMAAFIIRALGDFNPQQPAEQRFLDVPPSSPFYGFIEQMALRQITLGCGGGNYCPAQSVTREQMAAFIIRALGDFNPPEPAQQRFLDVPPTNPFYRFIEQMALRGITLGCGGGNYCPSQPVTRAQMAAFLVRAFDL